MVWHCIILLTFGTFPITGLESTVQSVKSATPSGEEPTCFQPGECTQSLFVNMWTTGDAVECLTECQNDEQCHYFTYYGNLEECNGFVNCEVFSDDTCTNCYSGQETCEGLQCWIPGLCNGILLDEVPAQTDQQCLDVCKANSECQWFTHDSSVSLCLLFENCPFIQTDCTTCTSGQRYCPEEETNEDYTKLMVIAGFDDSNSMDSVEVIDLDDPNNACELVENYPIATYHVTAQIVDGVVKVCGGWYSEYDCYNYDNSSNAWVSSPGLHSGKDQARSSIVDGTWLVSGDFDIPYGSMTEMWMGSEFFLGPTLPESMRLHCQVTINATHVFFVDCYDQTTYLLDWNLQEWTQLDDIYTDRSYVCGCGLINNDEMGKEVVVAGEGTSEIFNFDDLTWREGPELPYGWGYASVQLTDTFLLVGGNENGIFSDKIYLFDEDNYEFTLKTQTLLEPREYAGALVVPDEMVNCP